MIRPALSVFSLAVLIFHSTSLMAADQDLQEIPISINLFSAEDMADAVQDLPDDGWIRFILKPGSAGRFVDVTHSLGGEEAVFVLHGTQHVEFTRDPEGSPLRGVGQQHCFPEFRRREATFRSDR